MKTKSANPNPHALYMRAWREKNPHNKEYQRAYREKNKKRMRELWANWKENNKEKMEAHRILMAPIKSVKMKAWRDKTGYNRKYFLANRDRLIPAMRAYFQSNKAAILKKAKADPFYSLKKSVRHAVERITNRGGIKAHKSMQYLGCSLAFARAHIESQFKPGMSWENHGVWEIDHIKPIASFDFSNPESAFVASRWDNLQPLWKSENRSKWAKVA